jgi:hypothetical protein
MTTVQELINELSKIEDKSKQVFVWEGYNAGCMTTDFAVTANDEGSYDLD